MNIVFDYINATNKGLFETFKLLGLNPQIWNRGSMAAFDVFDLLKPDIAILNPANIDRATYKSINNYNTKVVFAVDEVNSENAFKLVLDGKVKFEIDKTPYANPFSFDNRKFPEEDRYMKCKFLIMSDWLEGEQIHKAIHSFKTEQEDVKIIGNRYISHPWYVGYVSPAEEGLAVRSAENVLLDRENINEFNVYLAGSKVRFLNDWGLGMLDHLEIASQERTSFHLARNLFRDLGLEDKASDAEELIKRFLI